MEWHEERAMVNNNGKWRNGIGYDIQTHQTHTHFDRMLFLLQPVINNPLNDQRLTPLIW